VPAPFRRLFGLVFLVFPALVVETDGKLHVSRFEGTFGHEDDDRRVKWPLFGVVLLAVRRLWFPL